MAEFDEETGPFLGIDPTGKSAEAIEYEWLERHYRGDIPQLTVRAVVIGALLGAFMSLSNLYIGLKTGWSLGVAITASVLSFSIGATLQQLGLLGSNLSILENNCVQSTASSAGYSTGSVMVSAVPALLMLTGEQLPFGMLLLWIVFLAMLGVLMAIPMKRQMINIEQLPFPSGLAAAETLRSLYARGAEARRKAKSLAQAGLLGALVAFARENAFSWWPSLLRIPKMVQFPGTLGGQPLLQWTIAWEMSLIMVAAGAIIGLRVGVSLLLGACLNYAVLAPAMHARGAIPELGYSGIVSWSLWGGTSLMVSSGLIAFAFHWRTIGRSLSGLGRMFRSARRHSTAGETPRERALAAVEVPDSWFFAGLALAAVGVVTIQVVSFSIRWWMGIVSVVMTFFLSGVACRVTGETDITPVGAMGKITQLFYGLVAPASVVTNLMTACVTAGAASSAADLLTDLKSGYLLGANPRKQFIAQFLGIFAGAAVIVPAFYLLVPTADALGTAEFPAPGAQVWKGVAQLMAGGLGSLHPTARWALLVGSAAGVALTFLERAASDRVRRFLPSAMGLGLAFVIPFWNALSIFAGALLAWLAARLAPEPARRYTIPVASGLIAGESLMGVFLALLAALGGMG